MRLAAVAAAVLLLSGAAAYETAAPGFTKFPEAVDVEPSSFNLLVALDEPGIVYTVVQLKSDSAPTAAQVKALTNSNGDDPVAKGMETIATADREYNIPVTTFAGPEVSTPNNPIMYTVYVVAEDDNKCPECADPYTPGTATFVNGCTEQCNCACTTGLCPCPNLQAAVSSFDLVMPFPWNDEIGPGYPLDWGTAYAQPISFSTARVYEGLHWGTDGASYKRRLLEEGDPAARDLLGFEGQVTETIGKFGTYLDSYNIMTQRHKDGHMMVQWDVTVTFAEDVENFDWKDVVVHGCFLADFNAKSAKEYVLRMTACDPLSRGFSPEGNVEFLSGRLLKYHGNVRTTPNEDKGGYCQIRIPDASYDFKSPVDKCVESVDAEGAPVEGGQESCGVGIVIPNMASDLLTLPFSGFVQKCPNYYANYHKFADSTATLAVQQEAYSGTLRELILI